jgi:isoleucyl-tRNA synthetase
MHAVAVSLFGRLSFKNVITTGNVNAGDGQKLSKSKKNYTDPYALFDKFGADAFRYYMMSSVVMQAEDLQFKDDDVKDAHSRVVNILRNTAAFYSLYKDEAGEPHAKSDALLDRWILARLSTITEDVTTAFEGYDLIRATRPLKGFIDDFSTWYVRRSRDRVKGEDAEDKAKALGTMRYVLLTLSKLIAPVMPFIAEEIFQTVKTADDVESVHLTEWPEVHSGFFSRIFGNSGDALLKEMEEVRRVSSLALEARQRANIKVRQPLASLSVKSALLKGKDELTALIADEVNVKTIAVNPSLSEDIVLDTNITKELEEEGMVRDMVRFIQDLRKQADFMPKDKAVLVVGDEATRVFVETHWRKLERPANLSRFEKGNAEHTLSAGALSFTLDVRRAQD